MSDVAKKNGDIEFDIKQLTEDKVIPREKQFLPFDYLSYLIIEQDNNLVTISSQQKFNYQKQTFLFGLRKSFKDNTIKIINPIKAPKLTDKEEIKNLRTKLWYIVNSEKKEKINEDYILKENDIIKFGDCIFEVIKINVPKKDEKNAINEALNEDKIYNISSLNDKYGSLFKIKNYDNKEVNGQNDNKKLICKICQKDSNDYENPLLKICKCNNHFKCLKEKLISDLKKIKTSMPKKYIV